MYPIINAWMVDEMSDKEHWHLSKSIPISIIFALLVYAVAAIWQVAHIDNRLSQAEKSIERLDVEVTTQRRQAQDMGERLARIEENVLHMRRQLDLIANRIER